MKSKAELLLLLTLIILLTGCKQAERGSIEHIREVTMAIDDSRLTNDYRKLKHEPPILCVLKEAPGLKTV